MLLPMIDPVFFLTSEFISVEYYTVAFLLRSHLSFFFALVPFSIFNLTTKLTTYMFFLFQT